eukprot:RCo054772
MSPYPSRNTLPSRSFLLSVRETPPVLGGFYAHSGGKADTPLLAFCSLRLQTSLFVVRGFFLWFCMFLVVSSHCIALLAGWGGLQVLELLVRREVALWGISSLGTSQSPTLLDQL